MTSFGLASEHRDRLLSVVCCPFKGVETENLWKRSHEFDSQSGIAVRKAFPSALGEYPTAETEDKVFARGA